MEKNVEINSGIYSRIQCFFLWQYIITLEKITTCSWNDCKYLRILKKFTLDKNQKIMCRSRCKVIEKTFLTPSVAAVEFLSFLFCSKFITAQSGSRNEVFVTIVKSWKLLTIITKYSSHLWQGSWMSLTINDSDYWNVFLMFNLRTVSTLKRGNCEKIKIKFNWLLPFWLKSCILVSFILKPLMPGGNKRSYELKQTCSV